MNLIINVNVFFIMYVNLVYGQSFCQTPDGGKGECISIFKCPSMLTLLNKKNKTGQDVDLLRSSKCGFQGNDPLVCCPKQSKPVESGDGMCRTPDGQPGKCISIKSCPHIANMLKPPVSDEKITYVKSFRCTGPEQYSVCCGPSPDTRYHDVCQAQMTAFPPDPQSECCGIETAGVSHIVSFGGNATMIDQHPWAVIMEHITEKKKIRLMCGGALISGKYVLTAAHCIAGPILEIATPHTVRLGEYDITQEGPDCTEVPSGGQDCNDGVTRIQIEKTIPHPEYDPTDSRRRNDIGLIRLKETAPYTDFIRPICLPNKDLTLQQNVPNRFTMFAVGWGAISISQPFSPVKVHVELPFVDLEKCQTAYRSDGRNIDLWNSQLCAGGIDGKDSCKGDSGGPLVYENIKKFEVTGIVSFGPSPCGLDGIPGIYTNVYEYLDWIKSTIVS